MSEKVHRAPPKLQRQPGTPPELGAPAAGVGWQVPSYQLQRWLDVRKDACVVIPVVNEGRRITDLLERMQQCHIARAADIVIVDLGSDDGSLDPARLRKLGVSALLRKTGYGKLSAQLRCAYAYAMEQGYAFVVTIDGNNKDDPAAIPAFLAALQGGADFVQASRYIAGGSQENTPKLRDLAIRYLHAPALAYASGFSWTDTAQGFRGYSRRLLLDTRLAVFRNVFTNYELLAYLSYRAPKLGFRCVEVATARRYPPGKTPTKISAVRGNVELLRTLAAACFGRYDPNPEP